MPHHPSDPQAPIEVEVLEIDGHAPPPAPERGPDTGLRPSDFNPFAGDDDSSAREPSARPAWQSWQGNIRTVSPLWWPLLLIVGAVLLFLLLTVGLVLGVLFLIVRTISRLLRALFS